MTKWMLLVASLALAACNRGQTASAQQLFRDASMLNALRDAGGLTGGIVDAGTFRLVPQQLPTQTNPLQPPPSNPYAPPSVPTNPYAPGGANPPIVPR